jgi:hypothetical protein
MFKIEVMCDDKNLPRVLHALTGLVLGSPKINPVVNAEERAGKVRARTNGSPSALLSAWLGQHKLTRITAAEIKQFCRTNGYSERSYSSVISQALKHKVLRRSGKAKGTGTPSVYTVIGGK